MASVQKRHTYYGNPVSRPTNGTGDNSLPRDTSSNSIGTRSRKRNVTFGPYIVGSTLGEGEFGKVKMGWTRPVTDGNVGPSQRTPRQVAIKLIRRDTIVRNSDKETKIYREINALKHLTHPNIIVLEEILQNSKYIGIVLEYASGGEFYKYIQRKRRLKEVNASRLFSQLVSGVHYMHSKGLVHRDLKLENLLLDKNENLMITDFGFVNEFSNENVLMKTSCGSPCYAAPELVVSREAYVGVKVDIWSCGVILYAMLAGYLPWDDDPSNPNGDDISKLYSYITATPLKFPDYVNPLPRDLLRRILVADPRRRYTLGHIENHEWLLPRREFLSVSPSDWDNIMKLKNDKSALERNSPVTGSRPSSMVRIDPGKPFPRNLSSNGTARQTALETLQENGTQPPRAIKQHSAAVVVPREQASAVVRDRLPLAAHNKPRPTTLHITVTPSLVASHGKTDNIAEATPPGDTVTRSTRSYSKRSLSGHEPVSTTVGVVDKENTVNGTLATATAHAAAQGAPLVVTPLSTGAPHKEGKPSQTRDPISRIHDNDPDAMAKKRFSFMSFYSSYSSSKSNVRVDDDVKDTHTAREIRTESGSSHATRHPNRSSIMVSQMANDGRVRDASATLSKEEKRQSTARKVINFFKRRSTRM
ncbi:putative serine/threonine protein kinase KIN4 KNAG_0A03040 [Huiozyma naganishii CBS 8797]|uniref:non-specific serine/threonine protein kinase n=1 Tax=Huiozyma naganishii (strain ATCC MYA-139 / BCRC 22969 / CBS 8797 / KCTC 17520 / NBRC 10181 / NCYC 3082 / Yp74L-3) TaxID=1071383 RepID=J7RTF6_HUIN7|nr:hypothetical protein KNAG_0A03040 [Kazachstania naganishii CBS 8797]CCK67992.1 hypothetical protein KNAG_0A03040 [Kazachstania naganishii CBS 8797]